MVPHHRVRRVPVLCVQRPGDPGGVPVPGQRAYRSHGSGHPGAGGHALRLCVGGAGLFDPLRLRLSHPPAEEGAGHLSAAGHGAGPGGPAPAAGDGGHGPAGPAGGPGAGGAGGLGPVRLHRRAVRCAHDHVHLLRLPALPGQDRPGLRRHLPAGDGLPRLRRLPVQAHRPDAGPAGEPGAEKPEPGVVGGSLPGRGGSACHRLRHAPHPGHPAGGRPVLGDDRPGQFGHPAVLPLPVRLPAAGVPEPEEALL